VVFAYFSYPPPSSASGENPEGSRRHRVFRSLRTWGVWRSTLVVLSAVPIAIFTNALRVSGTGILARYYGTKVADGFFHSFSGWVIYIAAFLLLFAFSWVLDRLRSLFSSDSAGEGTTLDLNELQPSLASVPKVAQSGGTD